MLNQIITAIVAMVVALLLANGYNADQAKYQVSPISVPAPDTNYGVSCGQGRACHWYVFP